jgi:23S rRNA G2069 N7-methylase RlmK/C1962 C5-methylase RlmI
MSPGFPSCMRMHRVLLNARQTARCRVARPVNSSPQSVVLCTAVKTHDRQASASIPRVILKGGKSKLFMEDLNPMVYPGAIDRVVGKPAPKAGDVVFVCNGGEEPFAWGVYNSESLYRVRILEMCGDQGAGGPPSLSALIQARIEAAYALRSVLKLPSQDNTVYRLINSEGDGLSGLIVDVLGENVVVIQSSAVWVEQQREVIQSAIQSVCKNENLHIIWRRSNDILREEGVNGEDRISDAEENEVCGRKVVVEHGVRYEVDPLGQKTGFYADQRDHRKFIQERAYGKDVLDLCCYTGGFALNAAIGGASSVVGVDSSAAAIDMAKSNAILNETVSCEFHQAPITNFMRAAAEEGKSWDIIVLDPPKLAPNKKSLTGALRKYESLNTAAMRLVRPGGLLMTCSCSGAVAQAQVFLPMLRKAARRAGRHITLLRSGGAAPDHPLNLGYPEGQYLTNVTVRVL